MRRDSKDAAHVRRENKLALIVGFSVLLVVAVLVSDHLSQARNDQVGDGLWSMPELPQAEILLDAPLASAERIRPQTAPEPVVTEVITLQQADAGPVRTTPVVPSGSTNRAGEAQRPDWLAPEPKTSPEADSRTASRAPAGLGTAAPLPITREDTGPTEFSNGPSADESTETSSGGGLFDWGAWRRSAGVRTVPKADIQTDREPSRSRVSSEGVYVVQDGDTLIGICKKLYGDGSKWQQMAALNKGRVGDEGQVYAGVTLKTLPGARVEQPSAARGSSPATDNRAATGTRPYTVKKGDTLSLIASREVGSVRHLEAIRTLNPALKEDGDRIFVGQRLTLPVIESQRASAGSRTRTPASVTARTTSPARTQTYTVKKGDTLSQIAQREVGSVEFLTEIRSLNSALRDGKDRIMVGQRLVLPSRGG